MEHTPENIGNLLPNEIFVFGSNLLGQHLGGAAKLAHDKFGARWGVGHGITGQCYAFPTLDENMEPMHASNLKAYAASLKTTAELVQTKLFLLTKVGCGIARFKEEEMIPLFADMPKNVIKPLGW